MEFLAKSLTKNASRQGKLIALVKHTDRKLSGLSIPMSSPEMQLQIVTIDIIKNQGAQNDANFVKIVFTIADQAANVNKEINRQCCLSAVTQTFLRYFLILTTQTLLQVTARLLQGKGTLSQNLRQNLKVLQFLKGSITQSLIVLQNDSVPFKTNVCTSQRKKQKFIPLRLLGYKWIFSYYFLLIYSSCSV